MGSARFRNVLKDGLLDKSIFGALFGALFVPVDDDKLRRRALFGGDHPRRSKFLGLNRHLASIEFQWFVVTFLRPGAPV